MKDNSLPSIGVLVLNRNGKQWLPVIYESIRKQSYPRTRTYLVDNASDDGSVEFTAEQYPEVGIVRMDQNLGYCMTYNLAMPYAFRDGCDWVIWANNDIRLEPGCLMELGRAALTDQRIGVVGPSFLTWEGEDANDYMVGNHPQAISAMQSRSPEPIDVDWVEGSFLMVSRQCVDAVGPLDPFLYFYWEEADFCRRARYRGFRVALVPNAVGRHYAGGWSVGNFHNRSTANMLQARNYYIYQLANPFQSFLFNLADAFHLFLVNVRSAFPRKISRGRSEGRVFTGVMRDIRTIHRKWNRDRRGGHPPFVQDGFSSASGKVIRSPGGGPSI